LLLTTPFLLLGGKKLPLPVNLPGSALMFIGLLLAALILSYRQDGMRGVKELVKRAFDYKKIKNKAWYIPILLLSPVIYFLSYVAMRLMGLPLPDPNVPILLALPLFLAFFSEAVFEELGWMGYALDPMQKRWGALKAGIILGLAWQIWHIIPDIQAGYTASWIFWHDLQGVALRILMVWIYNNTGKSVFSSVLVHAVDNVSWAMFPNFGSGYDPFFTAIFTCLAAGIAIIGWGPKTLAQYRHASTGQI
jgi:hypothetical protein